MDFHLLRPLWLLAILPLGLLFYLLWRKGFELTAWNKVCDPHLLKHLLHSKGQQRRHRALIFLFLSTLLMCVALAGPAWIRLPVPAFSEIQPRVLVLDLSEDMLQKDITPDRLTRAKFKMQDLFANPRAGQLGLVVYTGEPFVVSPLTDDAKTIDALLSSLSPDIMPVDGQNLDLALLEAAQLIKNAGFEGGQILVLTGEPPSENAIRTAKSLTEKQIYTSVMPMLAGNANSWFQDLASAGEGQLLPFEDKSNNLEKWLTNSPYKKEFRLHNNNQVPLWRDEGRWFLLPALILLLPVFRRGWLQRLNT